MNKIISSAVERYIYSILPARDAALAEMERYARRPLAYFRRAGVASRIHILVGDAVALIDSVPGKFDLIFNDVDKHQYPAVFRKALPRLRRGGLLVADNTLWSGRVARKATDQATRGIQEFNRL